MQFTLTDIDTHNCSIEELEKEIERLTLIKENYYTLEQSLKVWTNSVYGALGSPWFECYNVDLAEAITLQGQNVRKYASEVIDEYFMNMWHKDKKLHETLGITYANKVNEETVTIYADTDSVAFDTLVNTSSGIKTIEQWYNENTEYCGTTIAGHESVKTLDSILNWSKYNGLYYTKVKRIIKHKVSKPKWKIKTCSGKEIYVTSDHSLIIFRNNHQLTIKPKDILKTDKILCIK